MAQHPSADSGIRQQLIQQICAEWNLAEGEMKCAEQIAHALVMPSVNELRYAGRRIIDACMLEGDPSAQDRAHGLLEEAKFFCLRARHDAIDAGVAQIVADIDNLSSTVGIEVVLSCYSDFHRLKAALTNVQQFIVASRKDRENRDAIYQTVAGADLPELAGLHAAMMASEGIMLRIAEKRERQRMLNNVFGFGGLVVGMLGAAFGVVAWRYPHLLGG